MWIALLASIVGLSLGADSHALSADVFGAVPFFEMGHITIPGVGLKLQWFGILVASGVLIGVHVARKYGDRFAIDDDDMRGMTAWVVVSGFIGAHIFDVLAYQREKMAEDPLLIIKLWEGISSYGGFIGGALGWWTFQWWKRLATGLWADLAIIGLMLGFSIGRIGCTVVHDHMGTHTDFFLGTDYPINEVRGRVCDYATKGLTDPCPDWYTKLQAHLQELNPGVKVEDLTSRMHNLGMYEFLYLIPVNALILWLAFRKKKSPAGLLAVVLGVLYAPVRFVMEFLRFNETDPRYAGLTFAQWMSIIAFVAAGGLLIRILKTGQPAPYATELGPKEVGGRLHGGARITRKHLGELKAEEQKEKDAQFAKDAARKAEIAGRGKPRAKRDDDEDEPVPEPEPEPKDEEPAAEAEAAAEEPAPKPKPKGGKGGGKSGGGKKK